MMAHAKAHRRRQAPGMTFRSLRYRLKKLGID
jgi:hypothetical protein